MNKKGFTLTELMAVITLLALIAIIAFPPLLKQIKGTKSKIDEATENLIITGAVNYVDENKNKFPKVSGNTYCVILQTLVDNNKISKDLVDSKGNKLDLTQYVKVRISNNQYTYDIVDNCPAFAIGDLEIGTEVYYNPVENAICENYTEANSATGVKTGCMRWYVYKIEGNNIGLILDHNTTGKVKWISEEEAGCGVDGDQCARNDEGPITLMKQLKTDTKGWKVEADIIDALELVKLIPYFNELEDINDWESHWLDYHNAGVNGLNEATDNVPRSDYSTVKEYVDAVLDYAEERHQNVMLPRGLYRDFLYENMTGTGISTAGYWTKTAATNNYKNAWEVSISGILNSVYVGYSSSTGVRPVITIFKV